ncbi:hypothetical protein K490DRAFT_62113 [Saccharata proteae CBS 121410]|uniref:GST N-terminal domain-containing protein n=1 Tax=Saccharata proteae CBS 121410 TaxID=1314787 RepID=A0A9P4HX03_9PEZI|nr:hypothetical protein K490DRAFT_62113 [Saccharata proteae CBS 121410]
MSSVILYDLPSKGRCACWSLNPWKTRMALNYKEITYRTEWVEYPDVEPKLKSLGIQANKDWPHFSIPAAKVGDEYLMDSKVIAKALEKQQPSPSLHLDAPVLGQVEELIPKLMTALGGNMYPRVPGTLLNEPSAVYFEETRKKRFGMPLSQFEKEKGGEQAYVAAKAPLEAMAALLNETDGPYFMGNTVSYADFVFVGFLHFCRRIRQDMFERVVATDRAFAMVYDACSKWLERDAE